jgi:hypothetical protein
MSLLVVSLIISINCNSTKECDTEEIKINKTKFPLIFIKEKEVKIDEVIKGIAAIKKIESSDYIFVYFLSFRNTIVLRYNHELVLDKKFIIPYGRGPGECLSPIILGGDDNNIIVHDEIIKKYYIFNKDFKVKKILNAKRYELIINYGRGFSNKHNTILSGFGSFSDSYKDEYKIIARKIEGNKIIDRLIQKFLIRMRTNNDLVILGRPFHFKLIDEHIFILKTDEYHIIKKDLNGKILKQIKIGNVKKNKFAESDRREWVKESGQKRPERFIYPEDLWSACWIMELKDGFAIGRRMNYKPIAVEWIEADYFDFDLNYIGTINVPGFPQWNDPYIGQIKVDFLFNFQANNLFSIVVKETGEGEDFLLTRWRIDIEKR